MIILDATTKKLQIKLSGAVTSTQLPITASYVDVTTNTYIPGNNTTASNDTTAVDFVASPAASTERQIKFFSVFNADTAVAIVIFYYNDNGTQRQVLKTTLAVSDTLVYTDGEGFRVIDVNGQIKQSFSTTGFLQAANNLSDVSSISSSVVNLHLSNALPESGMFNGKIVPSVSSSNLTLALKTLAGTDASATDPIYVRIGDTVRTITSALSVTKNAGTNWFNAGATELATNEIDYFMYLGYNATDGVVIGFSRIYANQYSEFSTTSTNEKYAAISTITNAASTDYYEVVGRFAATLSAGAGYTWTVPTFTAINLRQEPVRETRWLVWTPVYTGFTVDPTDTASVYKVSHRRVFIVHDEVTNGSSSATSFQISSPFTAATRTNVSWSCAVTVVNNGTQGAAAGLFRIDSNTSVFKVNRDYAQTAFTGSGNKRCTFANMFFEI